MELFLSSQSRLTISHVNLLNIKLTVIFFARSITKYINVLFLSPKKKIELRIHVDNEY